MDDFLFIEAQDDQGDPSRPNRVACGRRPASLCLRGALPSPAGARTPAIRAASRTESGVVASRILSTLKPNPLPQHRHDPFATENKKGTLQMKNTEFSLHNLDPLIPQYNVGP